MNKRSELSTDNKVTNSSSLAPYHAIAINPLFDIRITRAAHIGMIIRNYRKQKNMTQAELADLAGVGRRFLSELENGKDTLEFGKVLQVSLATGFDLYATRR